MGTTSGDPVGDLRQQLAREIVRALGPKSQHLLAPRFGIPQPRMSELSRGQVDRCSVEWLIRRIHRLGGSVSVTVALGDVQREWTVRQFAERRRPQPGVSPRGGAGGGRTAP
jgi:predicted XRE-type DNA-binding protein